MNNKELLEQAIQYVRDNKTWSDAEERAALDTINHYRCSIDFASEKIYCDIQDLMEEWSSDNEGEIDLVSIDRCAGSITGATKWTHYANLQKKSNGDWELNEQFKGKNEDEMCIYGYFDTFGAAVRNLATKGTENRKPIKIN